MTEVKNIIEYKRPTTYYIGRPSVYGNPFVLLNEAQRDAVLLDFTAYWYAPEQKWLRERSLKELAGFDLGCYCAPKRCHGDIIAGYLNWKNNA